MPQLFRSSIRAAFLCVAFCLADPVAAQDGDLSPEMRQSRAAEQAPDIALGREAYIAGDHQAALDILAPLAAAGDPVAQNLLGAIYEDGIAVERDLAAAQSWWEQSAAQGYDKAVYNLGWLLQTQADGYPNDPQAALPWIEKAMEIGYPHGFVLRAELSEAGRGGPLDEAAAAEAWETAAELGVVDAMNHIGTMYVDGRGVDEDMASALYWFGEAAWTGDAYGLSNLGALYLNGYGVGQNTLAAMALFEAAARRGSAQAAVNLGQLLAEWDTGFSDPVLAYGWCRVGLERASDDERSGFEYDCAYVADLVGETAVSEGEAFAAGFDD